jgi:hypothetical protein
MAHIPHIRVRVAIRVYRIDPCSSNPRFDLEGQLSFNELELDAEDLAVRLTQDRLFFRDVNGDDRFFAVWNWVQGTGCKWSVTAPFVRPESVRSHYKVPSHDDPLMVEQIQAFERAIVACDDSGRLLFWDIPVLGPIVKPSAHGSSHIPLVVNPPKSFPQSILRERTAYPICSTSNWQRRTGVSSDDHICAILMSTPSIRLYAIPCTAEANGRFQAHSVITNSRYDASYGCADELGITPLFNCDNHLVFCVDGEGCQVIAVAIPLPTTANTDSEHQATELHSLSFSLTPVNEERAVVEDFQMGFCPMSGRLVHVFGPNFELRVEDFLMPPSH